MSRISRCIRNFGRVLAARGVASLQASGMLEVNTRRGRTARWLISTWMRWTRYRSWFRSGLYSFRDLPAALGWLPRSVRRKLGSDPSIVISVLGMGEMINCLPLLKRIQAHHPHCIIVLSRNPRQATRLAVAENLQIVSLPYPFTDSQPLVARWLGVLRPRLIIAMETLEELRVGMLRQAKSRFGSRTLLINYGGLSGEDTDWRHLETSWEQACMLPLIEQVGVTSDEAMADLLNRDLSPSRLRRISNIKYDVAIHTLATTHPTEERKRLGIQSGEPVVVFGSVYREELEILLEACRRILTRQGLERTRIILAPRYVSTTERILKRAALLGLPAVRATGINAGPMALPSIVVLDTAGELRRLYSIADVAIVAGSLAPRLRGHNPIEPAVFGTAVVTGPFTASFSGIIAKFIAEDALIQLRRPEDMAEEIIHLLENPDARMQLGRNAQSVVRNESGAEDQYMNMVTAMLGSAEPREP